MLQTVRAEKVDEKEWGHLSSFHISFLMSLNCPKTCIFYNFVLTSGSNLSLSKHIYIYASKSSLSTLLENGMVYRVQTTVHEILTIKISKKILTQ